jgi:hypothetical protein
LSAFLSHTKVLEVQLFIEGRKMTTADKVIQNLPWRWNTQGLICVIGLFVLVSVAWMWFTMPETKGKLLDQVDSEEMIKVPEVL